MTTLCTVRSFNEAELVETREVFIARGMQVSEMRFSDGQFHFSVYLPQA